MPSLVCLGSSAALPDAAHANTQLLLVGQERTTLVDCGSNPYLSLQKLDLDVDRVTDLIITHFHPDHAAGIPNYLLSTWLAGRHTELLIHGLLHTIDRVKSNLDLYDMSKWPGFFDLQFQTLEESPLTLVIDSDEYRVYSSPVEHEIPAIGLRFEFKDSGMVLAYSGDTHPCSAVLDLAQDADILIHEATGAHQWHTSAAQAGEIAEQVGARELILIHYPVARGNFESLPDEARKHFSGEVFLAQDFMVLDHL